MKAEAMKVLTEKEIKLKMAGYKSCYTKKINAAKTAKEKKFLEKNRETWLQEIEQRIVAENKKMIQRRAGVLSWETRRKNAQQSETVVAKKSSKKNRSYSSSKSVSVVKKH